MWFPASLTLLLQHLYLSAYINTIHIFIRKGIGIPALFLKNEINSGAVASIINALELSGTPEAQKALISIIRGNHQLPLDRIRAIVALGGIQNPTTNTLNTLWNQVGKRATPLSIEMSNTAALALRNISKALKVKNPTLSMKINSRLAEYSRNKE